ncbi:hypothetical protein PVAP13_6KG298600 [Panicum virgatum]|uniref:Uncharacterized protein n=1 Tax=Panicum virgatum TaxID=38727 RepID=A0A8T0RH84_PANVG|nr:hypothetical protein PVAP13_6KG298600 [Panicum virgatum]
METELWLLWAMLAVSLLYYLSSLRRGADASRLLPGPRPLPLISNLLDLRGHLHLVLARLTRAHGPVMLLRLGLTTAVVISSRNAAREAFAKHDRRLAARVVPDASRALGFSERSMIWLPSSDPRWKALRGIVATHVFSPRSLAAVRGVRMLKMRDLLSYLRERAGQEVDLGQAVYGGVLNLMSSAFFSINVVDVGGQSAQGLQELVEAIDEVASSSGDTHGDFLDALLQLRSAGKAARDNLTTILFDVFAAGSDTIAITVEWVMAELLQNPSTMARARAELDGALRNKETVEEADAASLPYLQAVVKEAMRLHPVAPALLPYLAAEDGVEVGGYAVPKGSTVIFNVWAIMRDPGVWEWPDEFLTKRFSNKAAGVEFREKDFEFIPFGRWQSVLCRTWWHRCCTGLIGACQRVCPLSNWT